MADPSQLPFVLKLLDDPSPTVRRAVREQLIEWVVTASRNSWPSWIPHPHRRPSTRS